MPSPAPPVVFWFRVYCGLMTAVYALVGLASIGLLVFSATIPAVDADEAGRAVLLVYGGFLLVLGLVLTAAFAAPFFLGGKSWLWVYALVLIAVGLTSCACWPITIPLLIYWIKPETRAYYGWPSG